jgi:uncharacterized membrane protein YsdA (DUF1294 family)
VNPPTHVRLSVVLIILALVPGLIGLILGQIVLAPVSPHIVTAMLAVLIVAAFWLWMARKTWAGRNWARILQTVLLALSLVGAVITVIQGDALVWTYPLVQILSAASVVLMWTRQSRDYFATVTAERRAPKPVESDT